MMRQNLNEKEIKSKVNGNGKSKVASDSKKPKNKHGYRAILSDFLENTTLHGLRYTNDTRITLFER